MNITYPPNIPCLLSLGDKGILSKLKPKGRTNYEYITQFFHLGVGQGMFELLDTHRAPMEMQTSARNSLVYLKDMFI
jgi:hypothetical protein